MGTLITIAQRKDLPPGKAMGCDLNGKKIAVFNIDGKFYAINDECTHAGGSLSEGEINGTVVTCPWHGATFEITSGQVLSAPAFEGVTSYKVQINGNDIQIEE